MRIEDLNSHVKGGTTRLKLLTGAKANQLNHYIIPTLEEYNNDSAVIDVGINYILQNKDDTGMNNLSDSILETANTYQNYNLGKRFISALLPSRRTRVITSQINETFMFQKYFHVRQA